MTSLLRQFKIDAAISIVEIIAIHHLYYLIFIRFWLQEHISITIRLNILFAIAANYKADDLFDSGI